MSEQEVVIQLKGISKQYRLGAIGGRTLKADLQSWWAKKRGREDPNLRIGVDARLIGKKFWALRDVNLTIHKGERMGIIGANGAGKSTMLKLLCRVTAPTTGKIGLKGRIASMLEVGTGFHGEMTGRENIYLNGAILGMKKAEIDARMKDIIAFSEVEEFIDTPVKRYSSGMFVKLAFSVAAHLNNEIMIMDEVLAVGDMAFQNKCLDKMRETADQEGRTILYVSHNMNTIRRLCDRCIVLDQGQIIYDGEVEEAIGVYMSHSLSENQVEIDLKEKSHANANRNFKLQMQHLTLEDKVTPVYEEGEGLRLRLKVNVTEAIDNVVFRLTLRNDGDVGIGTSYSEAMHLEPGEQDITFTMSTEQIAKGIFYASIGLYREDEIGNRYMLDHITRAFKIEMLGKPNWGTSAYGFVHFPPMQVSNSLPAQSESN